MAKCANCVSDALYVYTITDGYSINYCQRHLPRALSKGNVVGVEVIRASEPVKAAKKSAPKVEEVVEPVAEPAVVVEETPSEE